MDKNLYDIMQNLKREKGLQNNTEVKYLGTIYMDGHGKDEGALISKDIIAVLDVSPNGDTIIKYYDENGDLVAGRGIDGELFPGPKYSYDNLAFLNEIDALDESQAISLDELDRELDSVSKRLGIEKGDILSMSKTELDQIVAEKGGDDIDLSDDNSQGLSNEEKAKQDKNALDNINAKQEIDLNKRIDSKLTLADVLGVPAGSKLIVVSSDKIKNNVNSTRHSCLIHGADGTLEEAPMLSQVGGKDSSKNIYESNRDGSKVENKVVQSSYAIDSPLVKDAILTIRIGQMGTIEVGYGQMDKTSHNDAFTQRLETRELYPVRSNVRAEFNQNKGTDNISDKMDEIKEHEKNGCNNLTLKEADGNPNTGHVHNEYVVDRILSDKTVGNKIDDTFTREEVAKRFEKIQKSHPSNTVEENIELTKDDLSQDADIFYAHSRNR